jgi:hypothetical protein
LCHLRVDSARAEGASLAARSTRGSEATSIRGFSLASLMLLVTLVAIVLGLFSVAPGLGLLAIIVLVPALVRSGHFVVVFGDVR